MTLRTLLRTGALVATLALAGCKDDDAAAAAADTAAAADSAAAADAAADAVADAAAAKSMLAQTPRPLLINVHVPFEGEIVGTDLHVSYTDIAGLEAALGDKGRAAILYCKTGPMSLQAAKKLVALGYRNVFDLAAGFLKWKAAGESFSATKGG